MFFKWTVAGCQSIGSPVIIIWRQQVLMLGRPWEKSFLFMKRKTGTQECQIERAQILMQVEQVQVKARGDHLLTCAHTHKQMQGFFVDRLIDFHVDKVFITHVMMRVSSPGSPSTPSTNRGVLVKVYLFHWRPSSKLNLGNTNSCCARDLH